jgi:hypothetical protein
MAVQRRANATGGTYRFELRRVTERWIINGLTLQVAWVDGNQAVIASAP